MQKENKLNSYTTDDVALLLQSVLSVTVTLYPDVYETDKRMFEILKPKIKHKYRHKKTFDGELVNFKIEEICALIDAKIGFKKWLDDFSKKFNADDGIDVNYKELVGMYSSAEIILLYNIYHNLSNIAVKIVSGDDLRSERSKKVTVMNLPDAEIDTIEIVLRNYYSQDVVDIINRFCIEHGNLKNDCMSRTFYTMCDTVDDFRTVLKAIANLGGSDEFMTTLFVPIQFTEISELNDVNVIITTDYPYL